jgi:1-acyl-sn-glycerol-3-phosphate acyltransferase
MPIADSLGHAWFRWNYWLSMAGMTFGFSLRTEGHRHVPASGPALLLSNHQSFLDPIVAGVSARRPLCYLARSGLFRLGPLSWLMRSLHAVPINQEGFAREGLQTVLQQLQSERAVLVFPEGERTHDGKMQPLRPGVHLLIKRIDMPIVPVGIAGAFEAWPRTRPLPRLAPLPWPVRPGAIACSIGAPLASRRFAGKPRQEVLDTLFQAIQASVQRAERLRRRG